jgi:hypothetical protein
MSAQTFADSHRDGIYRTQSWGYARADILLPNRYSDLLSVWEVQCPCGASAGVRQGEMGNHFPPLYRGAALKDPFFPGTALCRNSGMAVTLKAAVARDERQTDAERHVSGTVRMNPSVWLGLLDWVTFDAVAAGDVVGYTTTERPDPYEPEQVYERTAVVERCGSSFVQLSDGTRLTAKTWKRARVRRVDDPRCYGCGGDRNTGAHGLNQGFGGCV